jgi:hypothetical protein
MLHLNIKNVYLRYINLCVKYAMRFYSLQLYKYLQE